MSEKFTKGPWRFLEGHDNLGGLYEQSATLGTIMGGENLDIHVCRIWNDATDDEDMVEERANAHLIAAAPEMYKLLKSIKDEMLYKLSFDGTSGIGQLAEGFGQEIFDVLKKARGEA